MLTSMKIESLSTSIWELFSSLDEVDELVKNKKNLGLGLRSFTRQHVQEGRSKPLSNNNVYNMYKSRKL